MSLINRNELKKFGFLIASVFVLIGVIIPFFKDRSFNPYLSAIAVILFLLAVVIPAALTPLYTVWMKLGKILNRINSFLILSIIFYALVTPIGIIFRMFKDNSKKFAYKTNADSYWIKKNKINSKEDIRRMF